MAHVRGRWKYGPLGPVAVFACLFGGAFAAEPGGRTDEGVDVYVHPTTLTPQDTLTDGEGGDPIPIRSETTFLWVERPAKAGRPSTEYVLISAEGTRVLRGTRWPVLNGKDLREPKRLRQELAALDGTWVLESEESNGMKEDAPADKPPPEADVKAGRLTIRENNSKESFTFKIDPSCTPKLIDLTEVKEGKEPGARDTLEGIYEIKGDRLRLCLKDSPGVRERPTAFETRAGSEVVLLTLRRKKM